MFEFRYIFGKLFLCVSRICLTIKHSTSPFHCGVQQLQAQQQHRHPEATAEQLEEAAANDSLSALTKAAGTSGGGTAAFKVKSGTRGLATAGQQLLMATTAGAAGSGGGQQENRSSSKERTAVIRMLRKRVFF